MAEDSPRIASEGTWTERTDIPKLSFDINGTRMIKIGEAIVGYNFHGEKPTEELDLPLAASDSSYFESGDEQ